MNKKRIIILILLFLIFTLLVVAFFDINKISKTEENSKNENHIPEDEMIETYYNCEGTSYEKEDYKIFNNYELHFQNGKIIYGNRIQTYKFNDEDKYTNFEIEENEYFNPNNTQRDDQELTVKYIFIYYNTQKENESEKQYIERMKKDGYKCVIERTSKSE